MKRDLPAYRAPFLELLAESCEGGLYIAAGRPIEAAVRQAVAVAGAEVTRLKDTQLFRGMAHVCWQHGITEWLDGVHPDALVIKADTRMLSIPVAASWMRKRGRPVLGWGLGTMNVTQGGFKEVRQMWRRRWYSVFDGMIAYSTRAAEQYVAAGVPQDRVFVAHNAATARPTRQPPPRGPVGTAPARLLFVGRLIPTKRLENLFLACAALPEHMQPTVTIVGDGPARSRYEEIAAATYSRVRFTGELRGAQLDAVWRESDLFVLPGHGGLAVQEAMAAGLPVVVGEADGTQADLVTTQNGWQLADSRVESLTAALREALERPERLRAMGSESFRLISDVVNLEAMRDRFVGAVNASLEW